MKNGFSMAEIIIVIGIIGIFSTVAIPSFLASKAKSRDSIRLSDLKGFSLAVQNYWQDNGYKFPTTAQGLSAVTSYFNSLPKDPQGFDYLYSFDPVTVKYCIGTNMEVTTQASHPCNISGANYTVIGP